MLYLLATSMSSTYCWHRLHKSSCLRSSSKKLWNNMSRDKPSIRITRIFPTKMMFGFGFIFAIINSLVHCWIAGLLALCSVNQFVIALPSHPAGFLGIGGSDLLECSDGAWENSSCHNQVRSWHHFLHVSEHNVSSPPICCVLVLGELHIPIPKELKQNMWKTTIIFLVFNWKQQKHTL